MIAASCNGNGDYNAGGALLPKRGNGGTHGGSGGEAIVDQDRDSAAETPRWLSVAVVALTAIEFTFLAGGDGIDDVRRDVHPVDHFVVQDAHAARCDCAHGEFGLPG